MRKHMHISLQLIGSFNLIEELSDLVISGINEKQPGIFEPIKKAIRRYVNSQSQARNKK